MLRFLFVNNAFVKKRFLHIHFHLLLRHVLHPGELRPYIIERKAAQDAGGGFDGKLVADVAVQDGVRNATVLAWRGREGKNAQDVMEKVLLN